MKKLLAGMLAAAVVCSAGAPVWHSNTAQAAFILEQDAQTAVEKNRDAILDALKTKEFTNDLTKDAFGEFVAGCCKYSVDSMYGTAFEIYSFQLIPATESKAGLVKAVVILSQGDGEIDFEIKKEIPKLSGGSTGTTETGSVSLEEVHKAIEKAFADWKVTNAATQKDLMDQVDVATVGMGAEVTLDTFALTESNASAEGSLRVKYTVTLSDGNHAAYSYQWTIAKPVSASPQKEIEAAKSAISNAIWDFAVSNQTTKDDLLNMAKEALPSGSHVEVTLKDSDFHLTKATTSLEGTVSAALTLSCDDVTAACPIGKTIAMLVTTDSKNLKEDWQAAGSALHALTYTNKLTKESLLQVAQSAVKHGTKVAWKGTFTKRNATFQEKGSIFGYLQLTLNEESRELLVQETIPMLVRKIPSDRISVNPEEWEILRLVNAERQKEGVMLLSMPSALQNACDTREPELNQLFSHTRPNDQMCFTAIPSSFRYVSAGENIYQCPAPRPVMDPQKAMTGWMNSPGHRANILKDGYDYIGVGAMTFQKNATAVQMFAQWASPIVSVEVSGGTTHFEDEDAMQKEYLICTSSDGVVSYLPIDTESMNKNGNKYTMNIRSTTPVVLTVDHETAGSASGFSDVAPDAYYANAVSWAVDRNITQGTSETTFSPEDTCTRAQILTFLWRAVGSPKATIANPFSDVNSDDYYYDAAVWAKEKGMVEGTLFQADTPCTRASTVTYLWKNAGAPAASASGSFADVPADAGCAAAVAWAVENGVTSGTSQTEFSPEMICSRGQIVTFLHRALQ